VLVLMQCREMLTMRQQLEQRDYKVNFKLARSCEADINKYHCLEHVSSVAGFKSAMLSAILLCLESAMKDGMYLPSTMAVPPSHSSDGKR